MNELEKLRQENAALTKARDEAVARAAVMEHALPRGGRVAQILPILQADGLAVRNGEVSVNDVPLAEAVDVLERSSPWLFSDGEGKQGSDPEASAPARAASKMTAEEKIAAGLRSL
jgi:hypothetical protein